MISEVSVSPKPVAVRLTCGGATSVNIVARLWLVSKARRSVPIEPLA